MDSVFEWINNNSTLVVYIAVLLTAVYIVLLCIVISTRVQSRKAQGKGDEEEADLSLFPTISTPDPVTPAPSLVPPPEGFMRAGYPKSQHHAFFAEVERLIPKSNRITLVATGLNIIWIESIIESLINRANQHGAEITICMGNPFSAHVMDRLIEEEMKDSRPPVGARGILSNIEKLLERLEVSGNPSSFKVLLFEHYPTIATLVFDDDIFLYPYAYRMLGNKSPVFHLYNDGGEVAKFYMDNLHNVISDAVPASEVINNRHKMGYVSPKWIAAAVYAIPEKDDEFYKAGTDILGYDIRNKAFVTNSMANKSLNNYVGDARDFGFHVTIADALYFASESALDRIDAELRAIAKTFEPFTLSHLKVGQNIDQRNDIVLVCEDLSGSAEALHHEMVSRIYPLAISSYYFSNKQGFDESLYSPRDALMINRYGAPYILSRFKPHYTLLADPPEDIEENNRVKKEIIRRTEKFINGTVAIRKLALVVKDNRNMWVIKTEISLGKKQ